jgi:tetratricopeptide (TPR) repeat protein
MDEHMIRRTVAGLGAAGLVLALAGCAALRPRAEASVERPDAPAEYDYLVGQEFELEGRFEEAFAAYLRASQKDPDSAFLLRKLAEVAARRADLGQAIGYAERALALEPGSKQLRMFLATLHRFRKDYPSAEAVLRDAAGDPLDAEAALLLYNVQLEAGEFDAALATARWLVAHEPEELRARFALAQAQHRLGNPAEAERVLREALGRGVDEIPVYDYLARLRREAGDLDGEIAIYRELLRRHPHHREILMRLAEALDAAQREAETRAVLEELEREHGDLRATMRIGFFDLKAERFPEAARRFERVLAQEPQQYEVAYLLGIVRRRMAETDAALAAFERVPPGHERFVDARTQMAGILERRGDYAGALAQVDLARQHQAARPLDLYTASLRAKSGDFAGAVAFLEQILADSPSDPEVLYNLGVIYGEARRSDEAIAYMQRVLELAPEHAGALNYIGYTWAEQGLRLDEAEALIVRALQARPEDGYITDSLGWVYYMRARPLIERGEVEAARVLLERSIRELERADELTGGDPVISEHLGDAYFLLNQKKRALDRYEEALGMEPRENEQPELRGKTERLRRELGSK